METTSKPLRQQRSEAEIKALLSEHEQSDFSVREFCEVYEISEQTFYNWRNKYQPKVEREEAFIPLEFSEPTSSLFAEIELAGKVTVRFFQPVDVTYFKALMR
jgi:hypothetical protein